MPLAPLLCPQINIARNEKANTKSRNRPVATQCVVEAIAFFRLGKAANKDKDKQKNPRIERAYVKEAAGGGAANERADDNDGVDGGGERVGVYSFEFELLLMLAVDVINAGRTVACESESENTNKTLNVSSCRTSATRIM